MLIPIILFVVLMVVVVGANASRKKGAMTEAAYSNLVSAVSVVVTVVALVVLYRRLRG